MSLEMVPAKVDGDSKGAMSLEPQALSRAHRHPQQLCEQQPSTTNVSRNMIDKKRRVFGPLQTVLPVYQVDPPRNCQIVSCNNSFFTCRKLAFGSLEIQFRCSTYYLHVHPVICRVLKTTTGKLFETDFTSDYFWRHICAAPWMRGLFTCSLQQLDQIIWTNSVMYNNNCQCEGILIKEKQHSDFNWHIKKVEWNFAAR